MPFAITININYWPPTAILLDNVTIANNTRGYFTPGISIVSYSAVLHTVVKGINYATNHIIIEDSDESIVYVYSAAALIYTPISKRNSSMEIIDSSFVDNNLRGNSQTINDENSNGILYFTASNVIISNTTISNNTGLCSAAIQVLPGDQTGQRVRYSFLLENSIIANNSFYVSDYYEQGAVQFRLLGNITVHNCSFVNNSATGLLVENSNIYFSGDNSIRGNRGYNGGGMTLLGSTLTLSENTTISFEDNLAENYGGGLYVKEVDTSYDDGCFITMRRHTKTTLLYFNNNSAKTAGNDW